jgi:hypothetical protein
LSVWRGGLKKALKIFFLHETKINEILPDPSSLLLLPFKGFAELLLRDQPFLNQSAAKLIHLLPPVSAGSYAFLE